MIGVCGVGKTVARPWGAVELLLLAAGSSRHQLLATVQEIGLETTVDILIDEIQLRLDSPPNENPVKVQFEVTCAKECVSRILTIDLRGVRAVPGWTDSAVARIRLDVLDFVDGVFGPFERRRHSSREVIWSESAWTELVTKAATDLKAARRSEEQTKNAVHALLAACLTQFDDLNELSVRFGSDKWAGFHWYTPHYEHHFASFRGQSVRLLEIGIGGGQDTGHGGESLRMWQRYFRRGLVYGLDIVEKPGVDGPRMQAIRGDQNDPEFLNDLGRQLGPFDIVIDDGSHINEHVMTSFHSLFPHVRCGGLYVIEDLQTAYWPTFGGSGNDLTNSATSVGMLKTLIDGLHYEESLDSEREPPTYNDYHVVGLHFYHNLAVIEKGKNVEGSAAVFSRK